MRRRTRWKRLVEFAISSVFCISKSIYHGAHKFSLYICAAMIFGYIVGLCQLNVCNIDNNDYTVLVSHTILSPELECTIIQVVYSLRPVQNPRPTEDRDAKADTQHGQFNQYDLTPQNP